MPRIFPDRNQNNPIAAIRFTRRKVIEWDDKDTKGRSHKQTYENKEVQIFEVTRGNLERGSITCKMAEGVEFNLGATEFELVKNLVPRGKIEPNDLGFQINDVFHGR